MNTIPRLTWVLVIALFACLVGIYDQQQHIRELERTVAQLQEQHRQRLTNLEHIANAHTEQIKKLQRDIFHLEEDEAELDWRTKISAWKSSK